ncbi:unnamed protein product [Hyaloperonospora brassicae]|uniref:tRNA/rRNA methyltransferase SpoU type domain-containing protein n=1 Tax=Hyaloperonospora brassicae TaxID=162125 RepID=A0AAV0UCC7_HYABA|nr:unnamed protein product [Hyaloperonospora brassicae]
MKEATRAAAAVAAAFTRWQRYHELHRGRATLERVEVEAQFALVATGLAASDDLLLEMFQDDAELFVAFLAPLLTFENDERDIRRRLQFTLVCAGEMLDRYLQSTELSNELDARRLLTGPLTTQVLLSLLHTTTNDVVHRTTLRMLQMLVRSSGRGLDRHDTVLQLCRRVQERLCGHEHDSSTICFDPLCTVLEEILQLDIELVKTRCMEVCEDAIRSCREQPKFLRAVVLRVVPALVDNELNDADIAKIRCTRLLTAVLRAWKPCRRGEDFPHGLLDVVCVIVPKAPREVIGDKKLQALVCFALRHEDALSRKQGLYVLKQALSHCAPCFAQQQYSTEVEHGVTEWQNFVIASEVIQMHHEQHLIEQVWPQVAGLLMNNFIVYEDSRPQQNRKGWPVQLTFDWMQGLFMRLFAHDNPSVKRLFISNFMETCVDALHIWEQQSSSRKGVIRQVSIACASSFARFVLDDLLLACNDPILFKHPHRARFQALVSEFLASFLAFRYVEIEQVSILDDFVAAVEEAIFGEGARCHSPEALLSMLQVFQSPRLKHGAAPASAKMLLSAAAVDRLRFLIDVHAMQSFSQATRIRLLRALSHALTGGFVNASIIPLLLLARVLCVFPISSLVADSGETMLRLMAWLQTSGADDSSSCFSVALASAFQEYLVPEEAGSHEGTLLSPTQLARLLLFTAKDTREVKSRRMHSVERSEDQVDVTVLLDTSLSALLPKHRNVVLNCTRLVLLVAKIEEQVQDLLGRCSTLPSQGFTVLVEREAIYTEQFSNLHLLDSATAIVWRWLDNVKDATEAGKIVIGDYEKEVAMEVVAPAMFVLTHTSVYKMSTSGGASEMTALNALCEKLKGILAAPAHQTAFDLALAAKCLSIVGCNAAAVDSLSAFESERIIPLLLAIDTSRRFSGKLDATFAISLATNKWVLLYEVLKSSSFVDTKLLHSVHHHCVDALPTAGMDSSALISMVNVLSITLAQLIGSKPRDPNDVEQLGSLLQDIWMAYIDSKSKIDELTQAVIVCVFQPVFLLRRELKSTMKHWIEEFICFGSRHRPNVLFHLVCRLCQTWRAQPASALLFADELVQLLLYKEPIIDEKEQLVTNVTNRTDKGQHRVSASNGCAQTTAIASHAKDRFVRLVVLSFLDSVAVDSAADTQQLMDELICQLIQLNVTPDWQKQHMLNSDGYGKKLRSWQALCVLSAHVTKPVLASLLPTLQTALNVPQLPSVRYYIDLFGIRMVGRYPSEICSGILLPMLRDPNLMPQVSASILLLATYLVKYKLDNESLDVDSGELLETMLPWLNSSHGYTRVLAQYLVTKTLPCYIHQLRQSSSDMDSSGLCFLEGTARYLSNNKECKRMLRRQARQLEEFLPDYESSLLGMLCSGYMSEFGELVPRDEVLRFSEQFKAAMNDLYAQYQLENFTAAPLHADVGDKLALETSTARQSITVQRKIDTSALLLDDKALPPVMRADADVARSRDTLNARQRPRQPIIMCASLVDKVPNLAGLARTCEIFNAQKMIVPNLFVTEQDPTFAAVSATACKWMPLEEVRPQGDNLHQALHRWKSEGYTIVAVEQTGSSVSLATYTLPRKMVLVLGRETEGIPVDVLQLVDVCVEIPQFGLVRSLNVHVSGALVLWEYTQQQLLSES